MTPHGRCLAVEQARRRCCPGWANRKVTGGVVTSNHSNACTRSSCKARISLLGINNHFRKYSSNHSSCTYNFIQFLYVTTLRFRTLIISQRSPTRLRDKIKTSATYVKESHPPSSSTPGADWSSSVWTSSTISLHKPVCMTHVHQY